MKKLLFILPILFFLSFPVHSQEEKSVCNQDYTISVEKCDPYVSNREKFATFSWDFSKISDFKSEAIKIEVVPILDCWNDVNGKDFRDEFYIDIKENVGSVKIHHIKMKAKCFKWRVVFNTSSCKGTGVWNYHSFLN
ncbi:hypothetical protein SAMN05216480_102123 [Pustulibacterium marinum]|uniref:Uncharacterized protein n=1 Tax=Pustulibacterium marinum TaxID=1224947 RepID=A0A1I7FQI8_9FLAO|nr:hypothetical protein [Pustulibacterium marinum]SFU38418.1 hypothetical protein SAMN05216480_102123 [Pustulibacterium marinum]